LQALDKSTSKRRCLIGVFFGGTGTHCDDTGEDDHEKESSGN